MEKCISGCAFIIKLLLAWQGNVVLVALGLLPLGCLSGILDSGWVWVMHISQRRPGEETEFEVPSVLGSRVVVLPLATQVKVSHAFQLSPFSQALMTSLFPGPRLQELCPGCCPMKHSLHSF